MISLDKIDLKIIQALSENGRESFSAIAREVGLTDVAIKKRLERLLKKGVIKRITAELNLKVLGFENPVYIQLRTELSKNKMITKKLAEMDYVMELYQVLGEYNILLKLLIPNLEEAEIFVEKLGTIDGVLDVKTIVVLSQLKKSNTLPAFSLQKKL